MTYVNRSTNKMMLFQKALRKSVRNSNKILPLRNCSNHVNPATKTWNILTKQVPAAFGIGKSEFIYPEHADVVIVGGGFIGASAAYWLKTRAVHGLDVVVIDKDTMYEDVQRNLSLGTLTQHFSLPENILLSQFSTEFFRNVKEHLTKDVELQYIPTGSLVLASEKYADRLEHNVDLLREQGSRLELLQADDLKKRYPWLNISDVKLGCIGYESEGVFNPWALLKGYLQKSVDLGATYINAEVTGFEFQHLRDVLMEGVVPGSFEKLNKVIYTTPDGKERSIKFAACILAAGDKSAKVAQMARVGAGDGILKVPLPITKREFKVYSIEDKASELGLSAPFVMDTSGLWLRRNGLENNVLFGMIPIADGSKDLPEEEYFNNIILPSLMNRLPGCDTTKIKCVHTEIQDCNTFDDTGILGPHPYHNNFYIAAGFGRLGCQHSPGIGRALAELIIDGRFKEIDFTRAGFDRLLISEPLVEFNIY